MTAIRDTEDVDRNLLDGVIKSERFMSLSVEADGSHRFELRPNGGNRYVIESRSLANAVRIAHEYIVDQDFEAL